MGCLGLEVARRHFFAHFGAFSQVCLNLLDGWLRRERFVYVGRSGLLILPTAYLSQSVAGSPVSPSSHPSTLTHWPLRS